MIIDMNYWGKVVKNIIILVATIIGVYLGFRLAFFYLPFLIAFVLSLLLEPIIRLLMRKVKLKRKTSSIIVFTISIILIVALIVWLLITLVSEASNLLGSLNEYIEKGYSLIQNLLSKFDFKNIQIPKNIMNTIQNSTANFLETISDWAKNVLTGAINFLTSVPTIGIYIVITLIALYFMCVDKVYMIDQLEHHMPELWVKKIGIHLKELVKSLGGYLKAEATLVLISTIICLIRTLYTTLYRL